MSARLPVLLDSAAVNKRVPGLPGRTTGPFFDCLCLAEALDQRYNLLVGHRDSLTSLNREKPARRIGGPGMQVTAGSGDGGVAERSLDEMDGRAAVESVTGMR